MTGSACPSIPKCVQIIIYFWSATLLRSSSCCETSPFSTIRDAGPQPVVEIRHHRNQTASVGATDPPGSDQNVAKIENR